MAIPGLAMGVFLVMKAVEIVRDRSPHAPWVRAGHLAVAVIGVVVAVGIVGLIGWKVRSEIHAFPRHWPGLSRYLLAFAVAALLLLTWLGATR